MTIDTTEADSVRDTARKLDSDDVLDGQATILALLREAKIEALKKAQKIVNDEAYGRNPDEIMERTIETIQAEITRLEGEKAALDAAPEPRP